MFEKKILSKFRPIGVLKNVVNSVRKKVSRKRHPFNDSRLHSVYNLLSSRISEFQINVIQQISNNAAEAASFYRFYRNSKVRIEELIKMNCNISSEVLTNKELLCLSDSTSFNMTKRSGRIQDFEKFGVLNDGKTKGFHAHASLALEAKDGSVIGLSDLILWNRTPSSKAVGKKIEKKIIPKQDKESSKWLMSATNSKAALSGCKQITFINDSEADDFDLFEHIEHELKNKFIIRSKYNRTVKLNGKSYKLDKCLANLSAVMTYEVKLKTLDHYSRTAGKRILRKARKATMQLRYVKVEVESPKSGKPLQLTLVEVREVTPNRAPHEKPLHWILWTNRAIKNADDAKKIIEYYLMRWDIEQVFRIMKQKGFDQEATELERVDAIMKQTVMTFKAAVKVMQLVKARNLKDAPPIEYVFDENQQKLLNKVNERFEGNTEKQKNPFPSDKLNWASWIIARLGGWKGYQTQKPPGPITMKTGLDKFNIMFESYQLFNTS